MKSQVLKLCASGELALFTSPALKVERISYPVMTPSAARGLIESVLWRPAIRWHIERIHVLRPIEFVAVRRNEVNTKAVAPSAAVIRRGGPAPVLFADEDRTQRNAVMLRDVDYVIEAHFTLTDRAGPEDNVAKFTEMFQRRVQRGQYFQAPYLGTRECAADVRPVDGAPAPIPETRDLGWMLWDIQYGPEGNVPRFFRARLDNGVLHVPLEPDLGASPTTGEDIR